MCNSPRGDMFHRPPRGYAVESLPTAIGVRSCQRRRSRPRSGSPLQLRTPMAARRLRRLRQQRFAPRPPIVFVKRSKGARAPCMCGRFTQCYSWAEVHSFLNVLLPSAAPNLRPRYNIAPTTMIDVVVDRGKGRELIPMRWGLIPEWWKQEANKVGATFNARGEEVASKPMFRASFRKRRCIIPASGFYEWTGPKTDRQPHYFTRADGQILGFDRHHRLQQLDGPLSQPNAGGARRARF
jgi:hypothetical protein